MTISDLEKLKQKGLKVVENSPMVNIISKNSNKNDDKCNKIPKHDPKGLSTMKANLRLLGYQFETEFRVHHSRAFRFDIALPDYRIGIEYEGLVSEKNGHTSIKGYSSNCIKYNLAAVNGWIVLRYTCKNYNQMIGDVEAIIKSLVI